ncbi:MAG: MerR family transcriptional regulator [Lachnospiraceae bacterium]|nr:MerR family transcriptional regulator [Lachnospiraceae bacterium]
MGIDREKIYLTTSEFAELNGVNKRTLHYYHRLGIFSPDAVGVNGYRYYTLEQSIELENILMLRELNMSIEEIKNYISKPSQECFIDLADQKCEEIDREVRILKDRKKYWKEKKQQLILCNGIEDGKIELVELEKNYVLKTPCNFNDYNIELLLDHLKRAWDLEGYKVGCGSYISLEKILSGNFDDYDGFYTPLHKKLNKAECSIRQKGKYIRGYIKGEWKRIEEFYKYLFSFADKKGVKLIGEAYEIGLNEYAISRKEDYITQITIKIED